MNKIIVLLILFLFYCFPSLGQGFLRDFQITSEKSRRDFLIGDSLLLNSLRPSILLERESSKIVSYTKFENLKIIPTPIYSISRFASKRPYGWGDFGMMPSVGYQQYISSGIEVNWRFINFTFQPEFVFSQNESYEGFGKGIPSSTIIDKFFQWKAGDFPERFGDDPITRFWWGQSSLSAKYGSFELGIKTGNSWWGPGQWNSLSFSNNSEGFPKISLNTTKPAKTFLGNFETELIIGKLMSSNLDPSQEQRLNELYFDKLPSDWRYLNALMINYSPKWVERLNLGFVRTFHVYDSLRKNTLYDWLPIFEGFQKKNFFENGNTVEYNNNGRSQQLVLFVKYSIKKTEVYFELGRRDHALNWRDYILSPEHARAYIIGFFKLVDLPKENRFLQFRGEITHQQESINRLVRYNGSSGLWSWHMNKKARGFTNRGQALGVGTGMGANVQTLEVALVEDWYKLGLQIERLENDQGFYYRSFYLPTSYKPWIDYSIGLLYDEKFGNLLLSSKLQLIHARNYQWQLDPLSTPEFPIGRNLNSILAQVTVVHFWNN